MRAEKEKLIKLLQSKNAPTVYILIGAVLILLILLSGDFGGGKKSETPVKEDVLPECGYEMTLEERLADTLSEIKGVGKVRVMITFSSSEEYIFAEDRDRKNGGEKTSLVRAGEGGVIKTVKMPEITGAVIVCEGGGNTQVRESVYEAVSVSLGISYNRISVLKMKT